MLFPVLLISINIILMHNQNINTKYMLSSQMISRLNYTCSLWHCCYVTAIDTWEFLEESSIFLPNFSLTYFLLSDSLCGLLGVHCPFWTYVLQCCVHGNWSPKQARKTEQQFLPLPRPSTQPQITFCTLLIFQIIVGLKLFIFFSETFSFSSYFSTIFKGIKIDYILPLSFQLPFVTVVKNIKMKATSIKWETL